MRAKILGFMILSACLLVVGRTAATPGTGSPAAEPTPQPVQYLAAVMNDARIGQTTPTPTDTPPVSATVGISGAVYLNPRWVETQTGAPQPVQYLILMDVTGSMSWDFNGYGTYDGSNTGPGYESPIGIKGDVQCDSPDNPNPLNLPYTDRCLGGVNSAWKNISERRMYVAKQALANLIDRMNLTDSMQIIAFSTAMAGNAEASNAWSSDKQTLINAITTLGSYQNDPYKTLGSASNVIALQKACDLLAMTPGVAPNGQPYKQVVIMLTDSVANVFLNGFTNTARDICANLSEQQALRTADPCQIGVTADGTLRPISAMIDVANSLKAEHPNVALYVLGLAHVDQTGLSQVASAPSLFYSVIQPAQIDAILNDIQSQNGSAVCTPAGGNQWVDSIDPAHLPDLSIFPNLSDTVVGYTYIYQVNSVTPLVTLPIQRDPASSKISFLLPPPDQDHPNAGIAPGTYEMMAYVGYKGNDQIPRQYDYFNNPSSLNPASRIMFTITSSGLSGPIIPIDPLFLDLAPAAHVCP
jgi:hypothetical protein